MASTKLVVLLFALPLLYYANQVFKIGQNYLAARRTKLPVLVNPLSISSPEWLFGKKLIIAIFRHLPPSMSAWVDRVENWNQNAKFSYYEKMNTRAFWIVNARHKELFIADPAAAEDVLRRCRTEFIKNRESYALLNTFGDNVVTTNGKDWERHRRATVPPFNERVSETVWEESARQAEGARRKWMAASEPRDGEAEGVVRSTQDDTTRIAFNVLSAAGFGLTFDFDNVEAQSGLTEEDRRAGHRMSYRNALFLILNDMWSLVIYFVGRNAGWPVFAMWGNVKEMSIAMEEYAWYMRDMLKSEREKIRSGEVSAGKEKEKENLMSVLIRNSEQGEGDEMSKTGKAGPVLSDSEVFGNLFIYNLAGHDTTAGALNHAIGLLAAEPKWQEWLAEEIDPVVKEDQSSLKYSTVFPKLHRCLALMYEVLRMYGPVPVTPRWTPNSWHTLTIDGKEYTLPPDSTVKLDLAALHHDPTQWADPLEFRPDRWIPSASQVVGDKQSSADTSDRSYDWHSKSLVSPTPGSFLPWTGGPRVCPGKKFSQVEFTRAIFEMFKGGARVRVVPERGESQEQAEERGCKIVRDTRVTFVLKMAESQKLGLKWFVKAA